MLSIRGSLTGLLCALCLALAGCGDSDTSGSSGAEEASGGTSGYPAAVAERFTEFCTTNARQASGGVLDQGEATELCEHSLECLEERLTIAEFLETERKLLAGEPNPGARVLTSCSEEAAAALPQG